MWRYQRLTGARISSALAVNVVLGKKTFTARPCFRIVPFDPALLYNNERHSRRAHGGSAGPSQHFRTPRIGSFAHPLCDHSSTAQLEVQAVASEGHLGPPTRKASERRLIPNS